VGDATREDATRADATVADPQHKADLLPYHVICNVKKSLEKGVKV